METDMVFVFSMLFKSLNISTLSYFVLVVIAGKYEHFLIWLKVSVFCC